MLWTVFAPEAIKNSCLFWCFQAVEQTSRPPEVTVQCVRRHNQLWPPEDHSKGIRFHLYHFLGYICREIFTKFYFQNMIIRFLQTGLKYSLTQTHSSLHAHHRSASQATVPGFRLRVSEVLTSGDVLLPNVVMFLACWYLPWYECTHIRLG